MSARLWGQAWAHSRLSSMELRTDIEALSRLGSRAGLSVVDVGSGRGVLACGLAEAGEGRYRFTNPIRLRIFTAR